MATADTVAQMVLETLAAVGLDTTQVASLPVVLHRPSGAPEPLHLHPRCPYRTLPAKRRHPGVMPRPVTVTVAALSTVPLCDQCATASRLLAALRVGPLRLDHYAALAEQARLQSAGLAATPLSDPLAAASVRAAAAAVLRLATPHVAADPFFANLAAQATQRLAQVDVARSALVATLTSWGQRLVVAQRLAVQAPIEVATELARFAAALPGRYTPRSRFGPLALCWTLAAAQVPDGGRHLVGLTPRTDRPSPGAQSFTADRVLFGVFDRVITFRVLPTTATLAVQRLADVAGWAVAARPWPVPEAGGPAPANPDVVTAVAATLLADGYTLPDATAAAVSFA